MRCSSVLIILGCLGSTGFPQDPPRVDRYWGEFEIARVQLNAEPFEGGAGIGLFTNWVPVFAQAVIRIEEAQSFTWEWLGITAPGDMALEGFPNLTFESDSNDEFEYRELGMDLNPISPNVWGSDELIELTYPKLDVTGTYKSFSTEKDFAATYDLRTQGIDYFFGTTVTRVDYSRFPDELTAKVWKDPQGNFGRTRGFSPRAEVVLEPKLRLGQLWVHQFWPGARGKDFTLRHTPTGDANNDGKVGFDDFLLLSEGFGTAQAAKWGDGDFDDDGAVGFGDFLALSANFGAGSAASVPEPATRTLLLIAIVGLLRCRRRD